ncbi:MAG: response regulator transcription factor [Thermodesulfobacteriota bacterium]
MSKSDEKTVLVIEDDPNTAALIALYLEREGFKAVTAGDGSEGLIMAEQCRPVLVILDLMLPKMDGWEVCRMLHQRSSVPVIMLTARGDEVDRVAGLTLGADDYVVKPFSPRELVARVKAVLRRAQRSPAGPSRLLSHGEVHLDLEKRLLRVGVRTVSLTPHEYALLKTLMSGRGKTFTRDELLGRLYPRGEAVVIDRVVDVHIGKLRQKIETDPAAPRYILTVRGIGYRFADQTP